MNLRLSLAEIVAQLGGEVIGDANVRVSRLASLSNAQPDHISFLTDLKYRTQLQNSHAGAVVIGHQHSELTDIPRIVTDNPYAYMARLSEIFAARMPVARGIAASAVIDSSCNIPANCSIGPNSVIGAHVSLGEGVIIGAGCVVGENVVIGAHTILQPRVVIYPDCQIGSNCNLFAGCVIGADGFGYAEDQGAWVKIPQVGRVVIEDDVDIGANTTIDRGTLDDTVIEHGAKLDNLIQVGHNCRIGAHSVIAGCVGIAGSAVIGKHCRIGGAAMILGHLEIADGVTISPGSMITRSISKAGTYTALMPFQAHDDWLQTAARLRHLGSYAERIKLLEKQLASMKPAPQKKDGN